ncbi:murein L,D-transpeptidase catalytic domain family protein [Flavobacterium sp. DG1-102-2]|uniref:murein L,D-transpeptidase catalytic domain-containing protein n=1 Tax=Flavobacterium sp. DG1-102-2 TaxID=3081663 RepID=UPI002948FDBA|nr:murein L,D-transpeptidase catalytic domain family protein [Flavobacterium sp. DG1-102-2]MDV6169917.1 murein L,D-transpeptidase catalytic domain family protein [Flavobacterium sp. DG1-102-2]
MIRPLILLLFGLINCNDTADSDPLTAPKVYTSKHAEALAFCKKNGYSQDYYFLVDLSIHSGKKRFFVYDFNQKKVSDSNLVTHGACDAFDNNDTKYEKVKFSNKNDSHCSSVGKYKVGKRDYSSWGIKVKYWLDGLEPTNANARNRVVVLHSWEAVANTEIYPKYTPLSWGCPAVSDAFMEKLDAKLQKTEKPVLLWIIE